MRLTSNEQDSQLKRNAIETAGGVRSSEDKISIRAATRPRLVETLDLLRPTDTLSVWKLDCLGRWTKEVSTITRRLHEQGAGLAAARTQGLTVGRPTVMDTDKLAAAEARRANGEGSPRSQKPGSPPCIHLPLPAHQQHRNHAAEQIP